MIKSVAIIGCGPSSLAAAWAAEGLGCGVTIFAPKRRSPLRGPIFLHRAIPGITLSHPDGYVKQMVLGGTWMDYRRKLYGNVNVPLKDYAGMESYHAWKMYETYDRLWEIYKSRINDLFMTPELLAQMLKTDTFDLIINTAPAPTFCRDHLHHRFNRAEVAITNMASYPDQQDNTVVYNAQPEDNWVRSSIIFGQAATEYRVDDCPKGAQIIKKPISNDCDCFPTVFRTGRFGAWSNETWVDTAYYDTRTAILS